MAARRVLVEASADDAAPLAEWLRTQGDEVLLAEPDQLDREVPPCELALLDVWTPEVAPRVAFLREAGVRVSCAADLVLERSPVPVLGITGTAGKTGAAHLAVALLARSGMPPAYARARLDNLWPTAGLLAQIDSLAPPAVVVAELTSSHLTFCHASPPVALVTSFWADHLELHGSLAAYREAKLTIVRHQRASDLAVVADDEGCEPFAQAAPGRVVRFPAGDLEAGVRAACAALGVPPEVEQPEHERPPHRQCEVATVRGVPVIDDSMAATPTKAAMGLRGYDDGSVVLVAGGLTAVGGAEVHQAPEEQELLREALDEVRRAARDVVLFGPAGERLAADLPDATRADSLDEALEAAVARCEGAAAVVVAPMFPVTPEERQSVAPLARSLTARS